MDHNLKVFEVDFAQNLKGMRVDISISITSWNQMITELGGEPSDEEVAQHFCSQYQLVWFYGYEYYKDQK
tara:strand:- start:328 stop:537 length:210 start_codon:yes stop_codon:yes gene_type:complete